MIITKKDYNVLFLSEMNVKFIPTSLTKYITIAEFTTNDYQIDMIYLRDNISRKI